MGNGARVAAIAKWIYVLNLPSDLCLNFDDCFYGLALTITLVECQIYASDTLSNEIHILDMSNPILNANDNGRLKGDNMKSSYSWHCRLGHTSERYMNKLHKSGSLESFDCDSFDNCESCLLCKDDKAALCRKG